MGLTIHYNLKSKLTAPADVRTLVGALRQFAMDLPFQEVDDLVELQGRDANFQNSPPDDPHRWLKIQAGRYVAEPTNKHCSYGVEPVHIIGFTTLPGDGCESANFGLCRYPLSILVGAPGARRRRLYTHLDGWSWGSFCKTQYASDPACGGVENFLRCHLLVVKMLDFAKKTNLIDVEVNDEGEYWNHRDIKELTKTVGKWNEFIAAFAGRLMDRASVNGSSLEAAIFGFANFEHLEAKGLKQLQELRAGPSK